MCSRTTVCVMLVGLGMAAAPWLAAQEPQQPADSPAQREKEIADIAFQPDVYGLFNEWLEGIGVDGLLLRLGKTLDKQDVAAWLRDCVLAHESEQRGDLIVARFFSGSLDLAEAQSLLKFTMGLFSDEVVRVAAREAAEEQEAAEARERDEQRQHIRERLRHLRQQAAEELLGRNADVIAAKLQKTAEDLLELELERAECEARREAIARQLAEEEPVLTVSAAPPAGADAMKEEAESALRHAREEYESKQELFKASMLPKSDLDQARRALESAEVAMLRLPPATQEVVNPLHLRLREMLVDVETDLAGLYARQATLARHRDELLELLAVAHELEGEQEELEARLDELHGLRARARRPPAAAPSVPLPEPIMIFNELPKEEPRPLRAAPRPQ